MYIPKPIPPELEVMREGWRKTYPENQYNEWERWGWFDRMCYWPDGSRRFVGIIFNRGERNMT